MSSAWGGPYPVIKTTRLESPNPLVLLFGVLSGRNDSLR